MKKTVKIFNSREEAEVAKSFLESHGIIPRIRADDQAGLQPGLAFSRGVELMVEPEDLDEARELLESGQSLPQD
ncbi:MAG TPA: DUF2007 domain-containing protein [Bdellovibrionota bacterium]|nr:DUF2007 domain-containing protein [Bdellovibrionota bacterium]